MKPEPRDHLDGSIVVWMAQVSHARDSLPSLEPCLDLHDLRRAAQFRFPEDRARFVLGRGLLRKCLGRYLGQAPETIELAYTDLGRPFLPQDESIQFSISHTHDLVAIALTAQARVGIDLEFVQAPVDLPELAERILSADDLRIFHALSSEERVTAFFRTWTRKEAYLKARGEGISEGLQQVSVTFGLDESAAVTDARDESAARTWRLHPLPVATDYMGSLACDDADKCLDFHLVHLEKGEVILDPPAGS
jgi:4'-phosphopantetheinyl transferase